MKNQKIINSIFLPLCIAAVCYLGYQIADTLLFSNTEGQMIIRLNDRPDQKILLTACKTVQDSGGSSQLVISDGNANGMLVYAEGQPSIGFTPIFQNQTLELAQEKCRVLHSTLTRVSFSPGRRRSSGPIRSWKGSIQAECVLPNGTISFTANIHACQ